MAATSGAGVAAATARRRGAAAVTAGGPAARTSAVHAAESAPDATAHAGAPCTCSRNYLIS